MSGVALFPPVSKSPIHLPQPNIVNAAAYANLRANPNDNSNQAQNEMSIAIESNNPNNFVIGANDARVPNSVMQSGYFATTDGGGPNPYTARFNLFVRRSLRFQLLFFDANP